MQGQALVPRSPMSQPKTISQRLNEGQSSSSSRARSPLQTQDDTFGTPGSQLPSAAPPAWAAQMMVQIATLTSRVDTQITQTVARVAALEQQFTKLHQDHVPLWEQVNAATAKVQAVEREVVCMRDLRPAIAALQQQVASAQQESLAMAFSMDRMHSHTRQGHVRLITGTPNHPLQCNPTADGVAAALGISPQLIQRVQDKPLAHRPGLRRLEVTFTTPRAAADAAKAADHARFSVRSKLTSSG